MRNSMVIVLVALVMVGEAIAEEKTSNDERTMLRVEFDNDLFFDRDSGFTAGWGVSLHGAAKDSWEDTSKVSHWFGRVIPGLDSEAGDGYVVRVSGGISQQMQTPVDLADPNLQLDDVPYAATLGGNMSWWKLSDQRSRAFQVYLGMVGPAALGEEVQSFIHNDLGMGDPPMGWDHQLSNEPLLNLNYELNEKITTWGEHGPGNFSSDLSAGAGAGLGNYYTGGFAQVDWRFGWGLPRGFSVFVEGGGRGISGNPVVDAPYDRWSFFFSTRARLNAYAYLVFYDGTLIADSEHPGVDYNHFPLEFNYGLHLTKKRFGFHFTGTVFPEQMVDTSTGTRYDFGTLSVDWLF